MSGGERVPDTKEAGRLREWCRNAAVLMQAANPEHSTNLRKADRALAALTAEVARLHVTEQVLRKALSGELSSTPPDAHLPPMRLRAQLDKRSRDDGR